MTAIMKRRIAMIKTRADARKASIDKWDKLLSEFTELENDVDDQCGFCWLARNNVPEDTKNKNSVKCRYCEPDAERLCLKYMTGDEALIAHAVTSLRQLMLDLKDELGALPDKGAIE